MPVTNVKSIVKRQTSKSSTKKKKKTLGFGLFKGDHSDLKRSVSIFKRLIRGCRSKSDGVVSAETYRRSGFDSSIPSFPCILVFRVYCVIDFFLIFLQGYAS